jgi:hypothetical protein
MYNLNLAFEGELRKLIEEEIQRIKDNLAGGSAVPDYETYKQQVGRVAGLMSVLEMCEEVKTTLSKKY